MNKKIITAFCWFLMYTYICIGQPISFEVNGIFTYDISNAKVHLRTNNSGKIIKDSCIVIKNTFKFLVEIDEPKQVVLILSINGSSINRKDRDLLIFFADGKDISIIVSGLLTDAIVNGSKEHERFIEFNKMISHVETAYRDYNLKPDSIPDHRIQWKKIHDEETAVIEAFIRQNSNSFVSLFAMNSVGFGPQHNLKRFDDLFKLLNPEIQNSKTGKQVYTSLQGALRLQNETAVPNFVMRDTSNKSITLHEISKKYILIDFWASWCGPCLLQNQELSEIYIEYSPLGFEIVANSIDKKKDQWIRAVKNEAAPWLQLTDVFSGKSAIANYFGITTIPSNILVDQNWQIISRNLSPQDLRKELNLLFKN